MSEFRRRLMMVGGGETPDLPTCLGFKALSNGTFTLTIGKTVSESDIEYIEYSTDKGVSWVRTYNINNTTVYVTTPTINANRYVFWRGRGTRLCSGNSTSKTYCCAFSSTTDYNAFGLLASLIVPDADETTTNSVGYTFPRLWDGDGHIKDASNVIVPPNIRNYCYRAMFYNCSKIEAAPKLPVEALASNCYQQMFYGCSSIIYVRMYATDISAGSCLANWMTNAKNTSDCIFVKNINAQWTTTGNNGVPTNWTVIYYDPSEDKYYTDQTKTTECDDHGNPI